jgi:hypothetical protein
VTTFCRHNRFAHTCPICSREAAAAKPAAASPVRPRRGGGGGPSRRAATGVRVRKLGRAEDDGYTNGLVPGLRASADARHLADELGLAAGRLAVLAGDPPGLYAEAAATDDREEALWLAVLLAVLGPLPEGDPFAGVQAVRVSWAGGEVPAPEEQELGPRGAGSPADARRALAAYRTWANRAGTQAAALGGEPAWTPERRFDRAYERLGSLPGFARPVRFDLLVTLGRLGLLDVRPTSLHLVDRDDASLAARRVFAIADRFLLDRRAGELAEAAGVPLEALDLALANLDAPASVTMGVSEDAADEAVRERAQRALGVADDDGS